MGEAQEAEAQRFTIERKINIPAVIALVISAITLGWQISNYLAGPEVELFAPDQIVIASSEVARFPNREGGPYAHIFGRMSYVNAGAAGYNATVRRESAIVSIPGRAPFEQRWYRFVSADATGAEGNSLTVKKISDAGPFPLAAGSSTTHLTLFQPWPHRCTIKDAACDPRQNYITWDQFLELTKDQREFDVQFVAETYDAEPRVVATCKVKLSERSYAGLMSRSWASPACQ
jgi:hypothetical protein